MVSKFDMCQYRLIHFDKAPYIRYIQCVLYYFGFYQMSMNFIFSHLGFLRIYCAEVISTFLQKDKFGISNVSSGSIVQPDQPQHRDTVPCNSTTSHMGVEITTRRLTRMSSDEALAQFMNQIRE